MNHTIEIDKEKCVGCGMCWKDCPAANIRILGKKAEVITQECLFCSHCAAICSKNAITITGFADPILECSESVRLDPDELLSAIKTRRTIRKFKKAEIPKEILDRIIEAGRYAPTGHNKQDVSFVVLDNDKELFEKPAVRLFRFLAKFAKVFNSTVNRVEIDDHFFFKEAPVVILVISPNPVHGSIAAQNMAFMAEANGLGVLFSGFYTRAASHSFKIKRLMKLKRGKKLVTALVIGYPDVKYRRTTGKDSADVVYR